MTDINAILDAIAPVLESIVDSKIEKALNRKNSSTSVLAKYAGTDSNGKQWVVYDGTDVKAPISWSTIEAAEGDRVSVTISNGRAVMDNNLSNPSAGVIGVETAAMTAEEAKNDAVTAIQYSQQAYMAAIDAQTSAESASTSAAAAAIAADDAQITANAVHGLAEQAQTDADAAKTASDDAVKAAEDADIAATAAQDSLKSVVQGATTVEKAVSVMQTALEAVIDYDPDEDEVTEYFWHDANGAHVLGDESGYRNDITSSGMDIVDVSTESSAAHFGIDGAQIGVDAKLKITQSSESFEDSYGNILFSVETDANKNASTYSATFDNCDGIKTRFTVGGANPICEIKSVKIDNVETDDYVRYGNTVTFRTAPPNGSIVKITYYPYSSDSKISYTLGLRDEDAGRGMFSVSEGTNCVASGKNSHAEGNMSSAWGASSHAEGKSKAHADFSHAEGYSSAYGTGAHAEGGFANDSIVPSEAWGVSSHAEGMGCTSLGVCSHAEGHLCQANGDHSHAQNENTRASSDNQTALGKFNIADPNDAYAVIVGNGTADNARSNALAVGWDGSVDLATPLKRTSGGTGSSNYLAQNGNVINETSNLPVPGSAWTDGGDFTLDPGTYLVIAHSEWASKTGSARSHCINTSVASNSNSTSLVHSGTAAGVVRLTSMTVLNPAATTTYHLCLYQNSGAALNCSSRRVWVTQLA